MMFRFFGMVAAVDEALRRRSMLFVPGKYVVLAVLCSLVAAAAIALAKPEDGREPRRVTIADLAAGLVPAGSYVTVDAHVDPSYRIEVTTRTFAVGRRPRVSTRRAQFLPFVDEARTAGVLLFSMPGAAGRRPLTVTGIVRDMPTAASQTIRRESATLPTRLHPTLMLAAGEAPMPRLEATAYLALFLTIFLSLYVAVRKPVAFREDMGPALPDTDPGHDGGPIDMRISATLRLASGVSRRFVEEPAIATITDRGDVALGADVDASVHLLGLRVWKRAGFWHAILPTGGIDEIMRGDVAFGLAVRPGLAVTLRGSRQPEIVLSFGAPEQRERFLRALEYQCGLGFRHAA